MPFKGTHIRSALERGEKIDLILRPADRDGDVTGAYGIRGGETAYEVRTAAVSEEGLKTFCEYLLQTYRPLTHRSRYTEDKFLELAHLKAM